MICGHRHEQKFKYPYSQDSKTIQMPYPWAKAIDQIPAICPPPAGLTLIGALKVNQITTISPIEFFLQLLFVASVL